MDLKQLYTGTIPNTSIMIFRIVFGLILLIQTYYFIINQFIDTNIINPLLLFPFITGLVPFSKTNLLIIGYIMFLANIGILFNKTAKISTLVFGCCFTYFWLLDKGYFNNHYYFISLICLLLFVAEKESSFKKNILISKTSLFSLQMMIFLIYFVAGINKLNPYWLFDLQPIKHILEVKFMVTDNLFFQQKWITVFMVYFGLLFDLFIGFLLFFKKTRLIGFLLVIGFNIINFYLFKDVGEIGVFPFLMISTLILFIDPNQISTFLNLNTKPKQVLKNTNLINKLIFGFLIIQFILPFRHALFKGYVDYNGVGQRFAWRMKIMYKDSNINYFIEDKISKQKYSVDVTKMLTPTQYNNLKYYPDLIIPLAKKIKSEANTKFNIKFAKISCHYEVNFMGKYKQLLFSPEKDLTKISEKKLTNKWVKALKKD